MYEYDTILDRLAYDTLPIEKKLNELIDSASVHSFDAKYDMADDLLHDFEMLLTAYENVCSKYNRQIGKSGHGRDLGETANNFLCAAYDDFYQEEFAAEDAQAARDAAREAESTEKEAA